jgi:hypothetical protein
MSLMVYTNVRGEFTESLIAPALLFLLLDLHPRRDDAPIPLRAALWPGLVLFTYLGKGIAFWGVYVIALSLLWALGRAGRVPAGRLPFRRLSGLIVLPILPTLAWLLAAQWTQFKEPLPTDLGEIPSIWAYIRLHVFGYGTEVKQYMVGGPDKALFVYTDFEVWPILALLAIPCVAALVLQAKRLLVAWRARDPHTLERALIPPSVAVPMFMILVFKGALGARLHVLYLMIWLPCACAALDTWLGAAESGRPFRVFLGGAAASVYLAWTWSWSVDDAHDWTRFGVLAASGCFVAGIWTILSQIRPRWAATFGVTALSAMILCAGCARGVLDWGKREIFEPGPGHRASDHVKPQRRFPNTELHLAIRFVKRELYAARFGVSNAEIHTRLPELKEAVLRARPFLHRAIDAHPDDSRTQALAGSTLLRLYPPDRPYIIERWRSYLRRHPDDREVARLLQATGAPP